MKAKEDKLAVYVGPFSFPNGGAAARRILGVSKTFKLLGFRVIIGTGQGGTESLEYDGLTVQSIDERTAEKYPKILKHLLYFNMGSKTIKWLDSLPKKPDVVVLYSGYSPYLIRLIPWSKKHNVRLVFDAVEWYQGKNTFWHYISPYYLNIELAMRYLVPKTKNVIAISRYLESYYKAKNCNTILIPPTIDISNFPSQFDTDDAGLIKFVYSGVPGRKDSLWDVIEVLGNILKSDSNKVFEFHIAGLSKEQAEELYSGSLDFCVFHGYIDHAASLTLVSKCDYTILFRPESKVSMAGFSTKVVESMACGTPVICNNTSDLELYITNEINGYIFNGYEKHTLQDLLSNILFNEPNKSMRLRARDTAVKVFGYDNYSKFLKDFLNV